MIKNYCSLKVMSMMSRVSFVTKWVAGFRATGWPFGLGSEHSRWLGRAGSFSAHSSVRDAIAAPAAFSDQPD